MLCSVKTWKHVQFFVWRLTICTGSSHQLLARIFMSFIRAVLKPPTQQRTPVALLALACDWQLRVNLGRQLTFPEHIATSALLVRPKSKVLVLTGLRRTTSRNRWTQSLSSPVGKIDGEPDASQLKVAERYSQRSPCTEFCDQGHGNTLFFMLDYSILLSL